MVEYFAFLAPHALCVSAVLSRRFDHACHASQSRFLGPFIGAYSASLHSYFPLTIRSTVRAPISTASRLVPRLHLVVPLSKCGGSSLGRRGARGVV